MLCNSRNVLEKTKNTSTRRAVILQVEVKNCESGSLIFDSLIDAQKLNLYSKFLHPKLYRCIDNKLFGANDPTVWLTRFNFWARDEGALCFLQDRNIFNGPHEKCPHCKEVVKSVDHLATRCNRILPYDYTRRHNEVEY